MYTRQDYYEVNRKTRLLISLGVILICAFFAFICVFTACGAADISNKTRLNMFKYLAVAAAGIGFAVNFFVWSFKIAPWLNYRRFMRDMDEGQRRVTKCEFIGFSAETRLYDKIEVYDMNVTVGSSPEDERLFVFDADKPLPALTPGQKITLTSFGNFVTEVEE